MQKYERLNNLLGWICFAIAAVTYLLTLEPSDSFYAVNNRIHNWNDGFVMCDELRFLGYGKPYTWFIQD